MKGNYCIWQRMLQVCTDEGTLLAGVRDAGGTLGFFITSWEGFSHWSLWLCQGGLRASYCSAVSPQQHLAPTIGRDPGFAGGLVVPPVRCQMSLYKEHKHSSNGILLI